MNQHYVPRVYLKNFATKRKNEYSLEVYDKTTDRRFSSNIKNLCAEKDLYTLPENSKAFDDKLVIENFFANVTEPMYQKSYDVLTNNSIFRINDITKIEILMGLFQLYTRNPTMIDKAVKKYRIELEYLFNNALNDGSNFIEYSGCVYDIRKFSIDSIVKTLSEKYINLFKEDNTVALKQLLLNKEDIIINVDVIKDDSSYITGDNPIPAVDNLNKENIDPLLRSKKFYIPINKKYCVLLYHDNRIHKNAICRRYIRNLGVYSINKLIIEQSKRFVFASKSDFEFIEKFDKFTSKFNIHHMMNLIDQAYKLGPNPNYDPNIINRIKKDQGKKNDDVDMLKIFLDLYKKNGNHLTPAQQLELKIYLNNNHQKHIKKNNKITQFDISKLF